MIRALFASALLILAAGAAQAGSLDRGRVPLCDDPSVTNDITKRVNWANDVTWKTGLSIGDFQRIDQTSFKPGYPGLIDRRFCHARVAVSDGREANVYYLIEERQGFASIGWGVEFCIPGQDPWRVYDGNCRTLRN
ncbi:hypothetical protein OSH11_00855 [Kaistia dalseonensis]|uniref:Uncharacterized protein n=1 Tax=Kaistia dalseonensis TaxID=410840 RepID=A0ABU0H0F9_9HYPH|nr:hypothetical protein [Kaistia dalseonensis]MCX5493244.1 hypothetical protein [Kaistia dalseonensis]MDQ0435799.1 hypothetical protein [Kaistia dalseonensis]